jgi:hypothetical protein
MHNGRGQTPFTDKGRASGHHIPRAVSLTLHHKLAGTDEIDSDFLEPTLDVGEGPLTELNIFKKSRAQLPGKFEQDEVVSPFEPSKYVVP